MIAVTLLLPDFGRFRDALERKKPLVLGAGVGRADREPGVRRLLALVNAKGIPVHVSGGEPPRVKVVNRSESHQQAEQERRGLPD